MKVKELIALLSEKNQEAEVYVFASDITGIDEPVELDVESVFDGSTGNVGLKAF